MGNKFNEQREHGERNPRERTNSRLCSKAGRLDIQHKAHNKFTSNSGLERRESLINNGAKGGEINFIPLQLAADAI
jgi:hypothetical protein